MDSQPVKVKPAEAARQIGVSTQTLKKIRDRQEIGFEKVSERKFFYYQTEIDSYLRRHQQPRIAV